MKWNVGTKIATGFGIALAIFVIVGMVSYRNVNQQAEDAAWVAHTNEAVATLDQVLSSLLNAETGQRGYIITGDESYLAPYNAGVASVDQQLRHLVEIVDDNPRQAARADALQKMVDSRMNELSKPLTARRSQDFAAAQAVIVAGSGKRAMDEIRAFVQTMAEAEHALLVTRAAASAAATRLARNTIVWGTIFAIILSGLVGFLITRNVASPLRGLTTAAERITVGDLGSSIYLGDRGDEVGMLGRAFGRMTGSLRGMATVADQIAAGPAPPRGQSSP
jgi:methyl-accepting chemotaxis protein